MSPFFSCLAHGVQHYISTFELSQSFSDISSLTILVDVQHFHENGKWILCLDKSKWLYVCLWTKWLWNGSCYSNLNFRRICLAPWGKRAPWRSDNYRVHIHSKACMWHDKNRLLKYFLPLYSVLSNSFIYSRDSTSEIPHGGTTPVAPSKNWIKFLSFKLLYSVVKKMFT